MQTLSLCDEITIAKNDIDLFNTNDPNIPADDRNIVVKALHLFKKATGINSCFRIDLNKIIPTEAGLGGGSGNGATTLWGLNKMVGSPLTDQQLSLLGAQIGSDVPFFFSKGTALVTGRGEFVEDIGHIPLGSVTLVKPPFGLSTAEVYKKWGGSGRIDEQALKAEILRGVIKYVNDLEKPAFELSPKLRELKDQLLSCGFDQVLMSGSGSCFFCLGNGDVPYFEGYKMYFAKPIHRKSDEWYIEEREDENL